MNAEALDAFEHRCARKSRRLERIDDRHIERTAIEAIVLVNEDA